MQARATAAVFFSPDRKWDAENIRRIYSKVGGAKHSDVVSIFQQLVQFKIVDGVRLVNLRRMFVTKVKKCRMHCTAAPG